MKGGSISGCYASSGGGAVFVSGAAELSGGEITGNASGNNGGGICINGGIVNMSDGSIHGNKSAAGGGGITLLAAGSALNMSGGSITGNSVTGVLGGGILVNGGEFSVSGSPVVRENMAGAALSNAYLIGTDKAVRVTGELNGAQIGITSSAPAADLPISGDVTGDCSAFFTSDNAAYSIEKKGEKLVLSGTPSVADIAVETAPEKTGYLTGESLELTGLTVKLTYGDGRAQIVALADFAAEGITVTPVEGTILAVGDTVVLRINGRRCHVPITVTAPVVPSVLIPQVNVPEYRLPEYIEAEEVIDDVTPEEVPGELTPDEAGDVAEATPDKALF